MAQDLGVWEETIEALKGYERPVTAPTPIQATVIPQIGHDKPDLVFADATGTGKTLAYLIPVMQGIKRADPGKALPCRPKALILVPNRELGTQICEVAKQLSHFLKLKVRFLTGGPLFRKKDEEMLKDGVDVLVATPGRLDFVLNTKRLVYFRHVRYVVVDEADTLLAHDFHDEMHRLFLPIYKRLLQERRDHIEKSTQFIFSCATLTKDVVFVRLCYSFCAYGVDAP